MTIDYNGIAVPDAYIKVSDFSGNKHQIFFNASYHAEKGKPVLFKEPFMCQHNLNGENAVKQAYLWLKNEKKFENAVDV